MVRYDRPRCGLSDRPAKVPRSLDLERDTLGVLRSAAGGASFHPVGSSLGVPIAIDGLDT